MSKTMQRPSAAIAPKGASYPTNLAVATFAGTAQSAQAQGKTTAGTIGANPNSTGGSEMKEIRDYRPERMTGATRFGDNPVKDMYEYANGVSMCQNPSDTLLSADEGDRS
jgi:hypothetical protein